MTRRWKVAAVAAVLFVLLLAVALIWWLRSTMLESPAEMSARAALSAQAFRESYLDPSEGKISSRRAACAACHMNHGKFDPRRWNFLHDRAQLSRSEWANKILLPVKCGVCHVVPFPAMLPRQSWIESIARMDHIAEARGTMKLNADERLDVLHFYLTFSPEQLVPLANDPDPARSPIKFLASVFGNPRNPDTRVRPVLGHVQIADLDRDGQPDVLVCDTDKSQVNWVHRTNGVWREETLASAPNPVHTQLVTNALTGRLDIVVACQRVLEPTDEPVGSVVLLRNGDAMRFTSEKILEGIGRVADVEPGDFDGDGDVDFVVAAYGFIKTGEVGWLEKKTEAKFVYHVIVKRAGAIHVLPTDLDGDGRLDFVALFAQEHEQVSAFINDGSGGFRERVLFKAATPSFGSSGIQLVDLDGDGDLDILYTNGDNMDLPTVIPRPYHGVQWLENKGNLNFEWHDIHRFYGAYSTAVADLNRDGLPDIVVTSMFNDWDDPKRASLIWLENLGGQRFAAHGIARVPTQLISIAVEDLDGDGWPDIVASGMYAFGPVDRMSRLTLWTNRHLRR